jgi:hypothetical protein
MVVVDRKYAGAAVATVLSGAITPSVPGAGQTFTVADATGYPVTGKFPVVVSRGNSDEEKILIASRSGAVFTVSARGYDGTTAQAHADQATVELALDAVAVNLFVDHVDDIETAPHATKLPVGTTAGHDVAARHTFGNAFPTPATPAALTPDIAGSAGAAAGPARADHVHNVPAAVAITSGLANAEGTSGSFARSDHTHDQAALSVDTAELVNLAVTSGKLGTAAVIAGKVAAGGVSATDQIADGIITLAKAASEASTSYVPGSFAAAGTFSLGTGGTAYGHYFKFGRILVVWVGFAMAADGNLVGTLTLPLPIAMRTAGADNQRGFAAARAQGGGANVFSGTGVVTSGSSQVNNIFTAGAGAEWDTTVPFNWGSGGVGASNLDAVVIYEAAA